MSPTQSPTQLAKVMDNLIVLSANPFTQSIVKSVTSQKYLDDTFTIPVRVGSSANKRDKIRRIRQKKNFELVNVAWTILS